MSKLVTLSGNNYSTYILNVQETHISNNSDFPKKLKVYSHMYHCVSTYSNNADPYSGIFTFIRKTETLIKTETLVAGRLAYIKIQNAANKEITNIFSIYCSPSDSVKQKHLITKIREKIMLDDLENCILLGDFNFVTSILDRNSQRLNRIDTETLKTWNPFENDFCLQDCFRLTNPGRRLYTFGSRSDKKIKSRID